MAVPLWEGGASPVSQVQSYTFAGTWEADDVTRIQVGNRIKDFTAGSATTNTVVSNLATAYDALDAAVYPEFVSDQSGMDAAAASAVFSLTAYEAGVPFTATLTPLESDLTAAGAQTIEGAGTATTGTTTTANAGPNVWSTAANWSTGLAPTTGDTFHIQNNDHDIIYGLSVAGATVAAGHIWQTFTGTIGLPKANNLGTEYPEYRTEYLTLDCSAWTIGEGPGNGSGRIKIDSGSVQTSVNVFNTGSPLENAIPALLWKGTHASNAMVCKGSASVGVGFFGGESATLLTLIVDENADVRCGPGCTLGTITVRGGTLEINSAVGTALNVYDGVVTIKGTGAVAQLTIFGGTVYYNTTGTLGGNTVIYEGGRLDFSQDPNAKTVTNAIDVYSADAVNDPDKVVGTLTIDYNGIEPVPGCGVHRRITFGAPA